MPFSRELWIEREDFKENPEKGYFRLFPGNEVRLRYGYVVKCIGHGRTASSHCTYYPDRKSGTPGADKYKVKGNIHWVSAKHALRRQGAALRPPVQRAPQPGTERDFMLGPESRTRSARSPRSSSPPCATPRPATACQFERHGYFVKDAKDGGFNRTVTLRDSWSKTP